MLNSIFKFEKSKYPIIPVAFWCVIIFSICSIFLILKNNYVSFNVKNFISPLENTTINIETIRKLNPNTFICYDDDCTPSENNYFSKVYHSTYLPEYKTEKNYKIKKITLAYPVEDTNLIKIIDNIDIHIGNKKYNLTKDDLSKIEKKEYKIEILNHNTNKKEIKKYNTLLLSDIGNYRGVYNNICCLFLSLFYNWKILIIPYCWLFLAFIFYLFNKDEIKFNIKIFKINPIWFLSGITLIGILLRLDNINYYPLWTDEVYTKTVAIKDFLSCFKDPGNPPLFFIFEYLITKIIGTSDIALRFLPLVFGTAIIPLVYLLFKNINKNLALFASFMASINTIFIYHSTEARGYTLSALLILLSIYFLLKYLKNPTIKKLVIYGVLSALCINQNYYLVIFTFANFIWGCFELIKNKQFKNTSHFLIANIIAGLTFLPYIFISFKTAISDSFNGWISPLSKEIVLYTINQFFVNKYIFLFLCIVLLTNIVFALLPENILSKINLKTNKKINKILIYLVCNIAFVLIIACLISIYFKPIFHKRVLLSIYMLLFLIQIINIFGIIDFIKNNLKETIFKTLYLLVLLGTYFLITSPMPLLNICRLDDFMNTLKNDIPKYEKDYQIHAITCDTVEYLDHYPEIKKLNIKWHFVDTNSGNFLKKLNKFDYIDKNKKSIIYFHTISTDFPVIVAINPYIDVFKSNSISTARLIYEPSKE